MALTVRFLQFQLGVGGCMSSSSSKSRAIPPRLILDHALSIPSSRTREIGNNSATTTAASNLTAGSLWKQSLRSPATHNLKVVLSVEIRGQIDDVIGEMDLLINDNGDWDLNLAV